MAVSAGSRDAVRQYYVRKFTELLMASCAGLVLVLLLLLARSRQDRGIAGGILTRPGYGESDLDQSLNVTISGEDESENVEFHLSARRYSDAQVRIFLADAEAEMLQDAAGENESLDEVRGALALKPAWQNGLVSASYGFDPPDMVDGDGTIIGRPAETGTIVQIDATLTMQGQERLCRFAAVLYPAILSEKQQLQEDIRAALDSADQDDPQSTTVTLPSEVGRKTLRWYYPESSSSAMLIAFFVLLPILLYVRSDEKVREEVKKRSQQLDLDYSELLWKLTLLLSAGLTIRGAMERIASQYEQGRCLSRSRDGRRNRSPAPRHYVYEELRLTLREIESGVPEAAAYENFGRRCQLPAYIKLGSLLAQNLTKGSRGLTDTLEREASLSLAQHKAAAKKMGEKAAMKLLMPMIMMLTVVLAILCVPALLSM